jgi:hypothetical protein
MKKEKKENETQKEEDKFLFTKKQILEKCFREGRKVKILIGMRVYKGIIKKIDTFGAVWLLTEQNSLTIIPLKKISVLEVEDYESQS